MDLLYLFIFAQNGNRSQQTHYPPPSLAEPIYPRGDTGLVDGGQWGCPGQGIERGVWFSDSRAGKRSAFYTKG